MLEHILEPVPMHWSEMTLAVNSFTTNANTPSIQLSAPSSGEVYPVALLRQPHLTLLVSLHLECGFELGLGGKEDRDDVEEG